MKPSFSSSQLRRFVIVTRVPRAREIRAKYASSSLAKFIMEDSGQSYDVYENEEKILERAIDRVQACVSDLGPTLVIERKLLVGTPLLDSDIIICIGQDGLVANTLRYARDIPIFGVNPDPKRYEGILLKFSVSDMLSFLKSRVYEDSEKLRFQSLTLGQCQLSTGASFVAANDFFLGKIDHTSALYQLEYQGRSERQSSSGIIVSTPMGATGWQKSVVAGAMGIINSLSGSKKTIKFHSPPLDKPSLRFWVREPWPSVTTSTDCVAGIVDAAQPLKIISEMGEGGVIFSDGVVSDSFPFPAGAVATFSPAKQKARLVIP